MIGERRIRGRRAISPLRWCISALPALPAAGRGRLDRPHRGSGTAHGVGPPLGAGLGLTRVRLALLLPIHLPLPAAPPKPPPAPRECPAGWPLASDSPPPPFPCARRRRRGFV